MVDRFFFKSLGLSLVLEARFGALGDGGQVDSARSGSFQIWEITVYSIRLLRKDQRRHPK